MRAERYQNIAYFLIAMFRTLFSEEHRLEHLIHSLGDADLLAASEAAEDLGEMGLPAAVPALLHALDMTAIEAFELAENQSPQLSQVVDLRQDIVRALGKIGDTQAVPALIRTLRYDHDRGVQYETAAALRSIATPEALTAISEWESSRQG